MKKILSLILVLALSFGAVVALSSCGEPKDAGAEIPIYIGEAIYDFDPSDYYVDSNAEEFMSLLYEPLFTLNSKGKLKKAAAKKYKVDKEERTITITLRETYWSDGVRVKADDYLYAWKNVILDPNNANPAAALFYDVENAVEVKNGTLSNSELGITASLYEITIKYREGANYKQLLKNLASVASSPIRQDVATKANTYWSKSPNTIMTNGPFMISEISYEAGTICLARNNGYHQSPNKVDYDNNVRPHLINAYFNYTSVNENGETVDHKISYSDISNKTVFYMGDANLEDRSANKNSAKVYDALSTYTYVFDTTNPLFAKKEVRQALSLAINRQEIVRAVTFGGMATGFISPRASKGIAQKLISYTDNVDLANECLSKVDLSGIDKSFTLTVNDDEESVKIAEMVKASWDALGFNVTIAPVSTTTTTVKDFSSNEYVDIVDSTIQYYVKEASYGNVMFDVIAVDWNMYSTDPFVALASFTSNMSGNGADFSNSGYSARANISGWTSAAYDELIENAFMSTSSSARNNYLKEAEKLLVDEAPIIPIIFNQTVSFSHKHLKKLSVNGLGNVVFTDAKLKNYKDYLTEE